jgi:hypothetical protein
MSAVQQAVYRLTDAGARVLSPADPRVVDHFGDFIFVASDAVRAIKLVESRHLAAIEASDFVWLEAPEGYVGPSCAMEIGFAVSVRTPVYCSQVPADLTLRQYVTPLPKPEEAIRRAVVRRAMTPPATTTNLLLDPAAAVDAAHADLERIQQALTRGGGTSPAAADAAAARLNAAVTVPLRMSR